MEADEIVVWHGVQVNRKLGSFSAYNAAVLPDGSTEVYLAITAGDEYEYTLHLGDTFPVRDEIWKLHHVENPGQRDWLVVLRRVD
jgi:hypothetical protein